MKTAQENVFIKPTATTNVQNYILALLLNDTDHQLQTGRYKTLGIFSYT
jgi:hypothetical protein